jgi:hypothetical protein
MRDSYIEIFQSPTTAIGQVSQRAVPGSSLESKFFRTVHCSKLSYANTLYELCFLQQIKLDLQVKLHSFITSALNGRELSTSCTAILRLVRTPLATGWMVLVSNPGGGEIFRTCPDRPWGPPSLLYNGYRLFPGVKERLGRDADPSPPSSAVGHDRVELYL